ncbi:hypothetical protein P692DRAFT_20787260 [Suillus brevipes Sb2]|nr:hypothetical protein P692DRAFT_20787260 [Suillus brevipes Sb2]
MQSTFFGYSPGYFLNRLYIIFYTYRYLICYAGWIGENERHLVFVYRVMAATADGGDLDSTSRTSYKLNSPSQFYQFSR